MSTQTRDTIAGFRIAPVQEQVWSDQDGSFTYRTECGLRISRTIGREDLDAALRRLIDRYEILRTRFVSSGERRFPLQVIEDSVEPDLMELGSEEDFATVDLVAGGIENLDKNSRGMLRVGYRHSGDGTLLRLSIPAIAGDGSTLLLLAQELLGILNGDPEDEDEDLLQYSQYAEWSRQFSDEPDEEGVAFWNAVRERGYRHPSLSLGSNDVDHEVPQFGALPVDLSNTTLLESWAADREVSVGDVLSGFWSVMLSRLGDGNGVTVHNDCSGREFEELAGVVGSVARTVPVTIDQPNGSVADVVKGFAAMLEESRDASDFYPFDAPANRSNNRVALEVIEAPEDMPEGCRIEFVRSIRSRAAAKLSITVGKEECSAVLLYDAALLPKTNAALLADMFSCLVRSAIADPDGDVSALPLLDEARIAELHASWNDTNHAEYADVLERITAVAGESPDAIAVSDAGNDYSYSVLMNRADAIAGAIADAGVKRGDLVALSLDRSFDAVASMLAALKIGAAWLPIDTELPTDRRRFMAEDSNAALVLTARSGETTFDGIAPVLSLETVVNDSAERVEIIRADASDIAYCIYTSGSTGTPKGCLIRRANLAAYTGWACDYYFGETDVVGDWPLFTSLSFDLTITSIFCSLIRGRRLTIHRDARDMTATLRDIFSPETPTDFLKMTPAQTTLLSGTGLTSTNVRGVILGGEQLRKIHVDALRALNPEMRIFNEYGPTETTVGCVVAEIGKSDEHILIGSPIAGAHAYVVNAHGSCCSPYETGELWIGGTGVGAGYLNRPELTDERFRNDLPFASGELLYKTGDRVRRYPDGSMEYFGRADDQVKVRGYRIEPGEIKGRMQDVEGVTDAAVVARTDDSGETGLIGYYVSVAGLSPDELRDRLAGFLPEYMVPGFLVRVDSIPLTINGKPDVAALPDPESVVSTGEYVEPADETEWTIARIWGEILGQERIGRHDDFFRLGGHSLRAMRAVARVNTELGSNLKVQAMFEHPTVAGIAELAGSSVGSDVEPIELVEKREYYDVSDSQRRLWVLEQMENVGDAFHIAGAFDMSGAFDPQVFAKAFDAMIERHEILRTTLHVVDGVPKQRVNTRETEPDSIPAVRIADLRSADDVASAVEAEIRSMTLKPFDLGTGPLVRAGIFRRSNEAYTLCVCFHHIIADGWSVGIMIDELTALYRSVAEGAASDLKPLRIQYKDFAAWQGRKLSDNSMAESRDYWIGKLKGAEPLDLPLDMPRPNVKTYNGGVERFSLDDDLVRKLNAYALESGTSLFMVLMAFYKILLSRYTGQSDITVGTAIAGRDHPDLDDQIGFYVNILALRDAIDRSSTFREILAQIRETATGAYAHQTYPFDKLIDELGVERESGRSPLFDVFMVLQNNEAKELGFGDAVMTERHTPSTPGKYDLAVEFTELNGELWGEVTYNSDVFVPQRIRNLVGYMTNIMRTVLEGADDVPVSSLQLLSEDEIRAIVASTAAVPEFAEELERWLPDLTDEASLRFAERIAVAGPERSFTHDELRKRSNGVAAWLAERLDKAENGTRRVVVFLPRSEMITLLFLGILKARAVYVPIDSSYPDERVRRMLFDSNADMLITDGSRELDVPEGMQVVNVGEIDRIGQADERPLPDGSPDDTAVIMYTSGSTGMPKGVVVQHRGLINTALGTGRILRATPESNMLQFASISFDSSLFETTIALLTGSALTVVPRSIIDSPTDFIRFLEEKNVTIAVLPPAYLTTLERAELPTLKSILTAGEPPVVDDALHYAKSVGYFNGYGPTECSICVTMYEIDPGKRYENGIPIGPEIPNTYAMILDPDLNLVPPGLDGELCVVGTGVCSGYLNEEQTARAFIEHPLFPGRRVYRTGDLARRLFDGNFAFIGRLDNQVKVRGHRVEPEETATHLREHPAVAEGAVIARKRQGQSAQLIACLVPEKSPLDMTAIRMWLSERLPSYMVPSYFFAIDELPTTPNGKIDRKKLLAWSEERIAEEKETASPSEAGTDEERILTEAVAATLGLGSVSPSDNYFMIGGDSIKAIQLTWKLRDAGYELQVRELFSHPILSDAALHLKRAAAQAEEENMTGEIPLTPIQEWFFESYTASARNRFNQSVLLRKNGERFDQDALEQALRAIVDHHDMLRARFDIESGSITQTVGEPGETPELPLQVIDLKNNGGGDLRDILEAAHGALDISEPPLMRATLIRGGDADRLHLAVHHLAVDAVSWHVMVGDLTDTYERLARGEEPALPPKTASYRTWSTKLRELAESREGEKARSYWQSAAGTVTNPGRIPVNVSGDSTYGTSENLSIPLDTETTDALIGSANEAYSTEARDLILAGLTRALSGETGSDSFVIGMEGHSRSVEEMSGIDISRTVGWFTSLYAVPLENGSDMSRVIKGTKERVRSIPMEGLSYGIGNYIGPDAGNFPDLLGHAQLVLNYFGVETGREDRDGYTVESEPEGIGVSKEAGRLFDIEVIAAVRDGALVLEFTWGGERIDRERIESLAHRWIESLREVAAHCRGVDAPELTPSDVDYDGLSIDDLDNILSGISG